MFDIDELGPTPLAYLFRARKDRPSGRDNEFALVDRLWSLGVCVGRRCDEGRALDTQEDAFIGTDSGMHAGNVCGVDAVERLSVLEEAVQPFVAGSGGASGRGLAFVASVEHVTSQRFNPIEISSRCHDERPNPHRLSPRSDVLEARTATRARPRGGTHEAGWRRARHDRVPLTAHASNNHDILSHRQRANAREAASLMTELIVQGRPTCERSSRTGAVKPTGRGAEIGRTARRQRRQTWHDSGVQID